MLESLFTPLNLFLIGLIIFGLVFGTVGVLGGRRP